MPTPTTPNLAYDIGGLMAFDAVSFFRKSVDTSKLTVTAPITAPVKDHEGDFMHPTGGNFEPHRKNPWVGLEHYHFHKSDRDQMVYPVLENGDSNPDASPDPVIVAWARDSLADPSGNYTIRMIHNLEFRKGEKCSLPFVTSYFDKNDQLSSQVFAMVESDMLPGVSMECKPSPDRLKDGRLYKSFREIGPSIHEHRPALEIFNWDLHGLVHCKSPVCPDALTVTKSDRLIKAVQTAKVGDETMHPLLLKSLSAVVPARKYFVAGSLVRKSMDPDPMATTSVYDEAANPDNREESGNGQSEYPTADGLYLAGQAAADSATGLSSIKGEHKKGLKAAAKIAAKFTALAQEAIAAAKNVEEDLDSEDENEVEPTEDEAADVDTATDDDGMVKCLPDRVKMLLKARRFSMKEIEKAERLTPEEEAIAARELKKFTRSLSRAK